jgi:hypothetical protein
MLHTLDIASSIKINQEPHIVKYWITGEISPSIKERNIKIIINDNIKKKDSKSL